MLDEGEASDQRFERGPAVHVARVQPPAVLVEQPHQTIQSVPDRDARRRERRLHVSNPLDERLQIVHPSQHVLLTLQDTQRRRGAACGRLERELQRVAELLQLDPDEMETLGQIQGAGIANRRVETLGATRHARIDHPPPLLRPAGRRAASVSRPQFLDRRGQALGQTPHLPDRQILLELLARLVALLRHGDGKPAERVAVLRARLVQLVYREEQDIELPDGAEPLRHLPQAADEFTRRVRAELQQRDQFSQPPRRHARRVEHVDIATFESVERAIEPLEVVAQQCGSAGDDRHGEKRHYMVS